MASGGGSSQTLHWPRQLWVLLEEGSEGEAAPGTLGAALLFSRDGAGGACGVCPAPSAPPGTSWGRIDSGLLNLTEHHL